MKEILKGAQSKKNNFRPYSNLFSYRQSKIQQKGLSERKHKPEVRAEVAYEQYPLHEHDDEYGEGESSVITEIVEEVVVNIESESEANREYNDVEERNKHIDEYLDMDREEYVNKEEYQDVEGMNSYDENQHENSGDNEYRDAQHLINQQQENEKGMFEGEGEMDDEEADGEIRHAGLQTEFIEEESKHVMMYVLEGYEPEHAVVSVDDESIDDEIRDYANSPIQENEDEQYSTPQDQAYIEELDERIRLFQLADEVKKKDQGRKFVLWELNQLRNEWQDKEYHNKSKAISQKKLEHHWNNDIARVRNSPRSKANAFDYSNIEEQNLPVHKPKRWMEGVESRIPVLADHKNAMKRKVGRKVDIGEPLQNRSRFNQKSK